MTVSTIVMVVVLVAVAVGGYFWVKSGKTVSYDKTPPPSDSGSGPTRGPGPGSSR